MTIEIKVPEIAESVSEATVGKWHKALGDKVKAGDVLLELETDKVNIEVTAQESGTVNKILAQEGADVKVGDLLGFLSADGAVDDAPATSDTGTDKQAQQKETQTPSKENDAVDSTTATADVVDSPELSSPTPKPERQPEDDPSDKQKERTATPLARKLAGDNGISLETIIGTGVGGKVTSHDVELAVTELNAANTYKEEQAASTLSQTSAKETIIKLSRRRLTMIERMTEAQRTAVMATTYNEADMSEVIAIRKRYKDYFKAKHDVGLGFMSFFLKAVALALKEYEILNAELTDNAIVLKHYYHIGVAIASKNGLVVPVIRDVDKKTFVQLEEDLKDLIKKARHGTLKIDDLMDGTFTVTNGGVFGSVMSTPIINFPQAGILGLHGIKERAVVVDGQVVVRPMMYLATTYDHRFVEGEDAIKFLRHIKDMIEQPALLLVED